jgi:hypothetical protein
MSRSDRFLSSPFPVEPAIVLAVIEIVDKRERDEIWRRFGEAANMTPAELEEWLETEESRRVGWKGAEGKGDGESVGHASGRRIVAFGRSKKAQLTDDDYRHMRKVAGYVARHRAQRLENVVTSRWRYSLMNWGHDPLKE